MIAEQPTGYVASVNSANKQRGEIPAPRNNWLLTTGGCFQFRLLPVPDVPDVTDVPDMEQPYEYFIGCFCYVKAFAKPTLIWIYHYQLQLTRNSRGSSTTSMKKAQIWRIIRQRSAENLNKTTTKNEPHSFECLLFEQYAAIYLPAEQINKESHSCSIDSAATLSIPLRCSASIRSYEQ